VDIDGSTTGLSFPEHGTHIQSSWHGTWDCDQCHHKPTDALSSGHVFLGDSTAGIAEVGFRGGLSSSGTYGGSGSCSNLYCHGDGAGGLGSARTGDGETCGSCHAAPPRSGEHGEHDRYDCDECHASTASGSSSIVSPPDEHVDGEVDVDLARGGTWNGTTCDPSCHGAERW
jgi:predicted CxxxxCH...CXXCH cytochrome family protein